MKKIQYGIIGFGGIAESRIAREGFGLDKTRFNGHPYAELIGATDINPDRQKAAENLGIRWYHNLNEILNDSNIDAVFIATNNSNHYPIAKAAIENGKHCIVEKPIATRIEEAEDLQRMAQLKKVSLTVDHMMTKNAYNKKAKDLINVGSVGDVNDITLHMEFLYGSTEAEAATWRCARPEEIGGPIGDVGSHCLYMAEFLLDDEIQEISCVFTPKTLNINVENGAFIHFKTQKGINGTARVAFNQPRGGLVGTLSNLGYEIYGTEGALRSFGTLFQLSGHAGEPVKLRLECETATKNETIVVSDFENIYQSQITEHVLSIQNEKPFDGTNAIHNLKLLFACFESAENGSKSVLIK